MERFKRFIKVFIITYIISVAIMFATDPRGPGSILGVGLILAFLGALFSLSLDTKSEKLEKKAKREREEENRKREKERQEENKRRAEQERHGPGCHSMDGVDILTFNSSNNILTAGNNFISFKIRNRNAYGVIVSVKFKYSGEWDKYVDNFQVSGNELKTIQTSGRAWRKASDISIVAVH